MSLNIPLGVTVRPMRGLPADKSGLTDVFLGRYIASCTILYSVLGIKAKRGHLRVRCVIAPDGALYMAGSEAES